jgi:hypothetical protein
MISKLLFFFDIRVGGLDVVSTIDDREVSPGFALKGYGTCRSGRPPTKGRRDLLACRGFNGVFSSSISALLPSKKLAFILYT